jgi:hypothetical protein
MELTAALMFSMPILVTGARWQYFSPIRYGTPHYIAFVKAIVSLCSKHE